MIEEIYPILKNRPFQIDVIEKILNSDKKYILLDSPTGSGKTIIALVLSDYYWKNNLITHIAVRTNEEIKRYLEDSNKINTILKVFPNKKKTCPIFFKSNLSGEEIICSDCILRKKLYKPEKLWELLKKAKYNFELLAKRENKRLNKGKAKCIYHSFKRIDSKIYISTYPYVFNQYLFDLLSLEGEPDILIMDESHNILTTITNPYSISFRKYIRNSFRKRGENNLLYKELKEEISAIGDLLGIPLEDIKFLDNAIRDLSDSLLNFIENILIKLYKTNDPLLLIERIEKDITNREIVIDREKLLEIFDKHQKALENLIEYWDIYKKIVSKTGNIKKSRWNINKILKFYLFLNDSNIFWILNRYKIEGYITKFNIIIKALDNYSKVILMSGSNFTKEEFSKLFGIKLDNIEYIKVNIKLGNKKAEIITNFSSKYDKRKDKRNIENLIGDIKFIYEKFDKYQLYMFPSAGFMNFIYDQLDIKDKIYLDDGKRSLNKILKTDKEIIFTYSRSRFIEGVQLVKNNRSLLRTIVIIGKPYPPPPTASYLTYKILKDNNLNYWDFAKTLEYITIKQVIGRAIRFPDDEVNIIFIDERFGYSEIKKYL